MSLLERIRECNAHDLARYLPFTVAGVQVGWIARARAPRLGDHPGVFDVGPESVALCDDLDSFEARSQAVEKVARELARDGLIADWRGEAYPVLPLSDRRRKGTPLLRIDRGAAPFFGVRVFGVHLNGVVAGALPAMWVARRSANATLHPGKLDQLVAGGLPLDLDPLGCLVKEAQEEAGITPTLARSATAAGRLSYCVETPAGLSPATMFVYDLTLPAVFKPGNRDGEISDFALLPLQGVRAKVAAGRDFKPNANLVVIDFLLRHRHITAKDPDFEALKAGLR